MNGGALPETEELSRLLLSHEQIAVIEAAIQEIDERPDSYDLGFFWKLDSSIGGIGGYCMLFDSTRNPFPSGIGRSLFRPLQYAAEEIDGNKSIHNNARWAVLSSGQHLEAATKYVMKKRIPFLMRPIGLEKFTLGKSIHILTEKDILPSNMVKPSGLFTELYNKSKHDINQDEERERLFAPADALISYISARIIGKKLLKRYYSEILQEVGPFLNGLNGLNMGI